MSEEYKDINIEETEEENRSRDILKIYLEELEGIAPLKDEEVKTADRNRLIEGCLKKALQCLYDFLNQGVELPELVAEANLALVQTVDEFLTGGRQGDFDGLIKENIKNAVIGIIDDTNETHNADEQIAERLNELSDVSVEMVQELGRGATNAELAHRLNVSEDEIERLLKMSVNAL